VSSLWLIRRSFYFVTGKSKGTTYQSQRWHFPTDLVMLYPIGQGIIIQRLIHPQLRPWNNIPRRCRVLTLTCHLLSVSYHLYIWDLKCRFLKRLFGQASKFFCYFSKMLRSILLCWHLLMYLIILSPWATARTYSTSTSTIWRRYHD